VIEASEYYSRLTSPWQKSIPEVDLSPSLSPILNQTYSSSFKKDQLLTEEQSWGSLDYTKGALPRAAAELDFCVVREGTAHGVCLWFETKLFEEIGYSSGPESAGTIYGQLFSLGSSRWQLRRGKKFNWGCMLILLVRITFWRWETRISAGPKNAEFQFQQSTFQGANFSPDSLRRQAVDYAPVFSQAGQADFWILERMDGKNHLAGNCAVGLPAVPAPLLFLARSLPTRSGPFQRFFPLAWVPPAHRRVCGSCPSGKRLAMPRTFALQL